MSTLKTALTIDTSQLVDGPTETANATDVTTPLDDLLDHIKGGLLSVSSNDTHVKTLGEALTISGSGITKSEQNDGDDETLQLALATKLEQLLALLATGGKVPASAIDSTGASNGDVLTANGSGGASFAASGGGGAEPIDIVVTAGEDLALRDFVYLNESDNEWYKIDVDADPIACGPERGCVIESGGITNGNTGTVRILGAVDGFTGLTAMGRVWASSTAGGYTQTKPEPSLGGSQVAVVPMGRATSTTAILIKPLPVQYMLADTLANDASLVIKHHIDEQGRERTLKLYLASESTGSSLTSYGSGNQDSNVELEGPVLSGDSITWSASGTLAALGDLSGSEYRLAQSFTTVNGGVFSQFTVDFGANVNSPSGDVTWTLETDNAGSPSGTVLDIGTFTPTPSATNTVNVSNGPTLDAAMIYWITLSVPAQSTNNRYQVVAQSTSAYAGGEYQYTINGGAWQDPGSYDMDMTITISSINENDKLGQSFQVTGTQTIDLVKLYLKKTGSPTGTLTLRIETDNTGEPSGTLVDANATVTVAESSLSTSYALVDFDFGTNFSISGSTTYWLVLSTDRAQSNSNYVTWGADVSSPSYANGEGKSQTSSVWSAESVDFIFEVFAPGVQYDSPAQFDFWDTAQSVFAARFDDGSGSNANTQTTIKNKTGSSKDVIAIVELV